MLSSYWCWENCATKDSSKQVKYSAVVCTYNKSLYLSIKRDLIFLNGANRQCSPALPTKYYELEGTKCSKVWICPPDLSSLAEAPFFYLYSLFCTWNSLLLPLPYFPPRMPRVMIDCSTEHSRSILFRFLKIEIQSIYNIVLVPGIQHVGLMILYITRCPPWQVLSPSVSTQHYYKLWTMFPVLYSSSLLLIHL